VAVIRSADRDLLRGDFVTEPFPYAALPAYQNWRSAVSAQPDGAAIDPQGPVKFRFAPSARIASAGSCFAQRLAVRLRELGLGYVVAEPGGEPLSARYGNVYTSRQLVQLLERALRRFDPLERVWTAPEGFLDPFRPGIEDGAFPSVAAVEANRAAHLAAVRSLLSNVDAFLFTLGLTEVWVDRRDGAAFPVVPGRGRGVFDPGRYALVNLGVDDVQADLERFIALFGEINPSGKLILTVSPVPVAATMTSTHVVRASLYSKSVLKVAAENVAARHAHVDYFAAYDTVMQNLGAERLFDGRKPTDEIADRVVRFFVRDYFGGAVALPPPQRAQPAQPRGAERPCDEDLLLARIAADDARRAEDAAPALRAGGGAAVEQIAHPVPLYFAGDSNSLIFKDRVFSIPGSAAPYLGRTMHTPGLGAFDLCDVDGNLNFNLLSRLVGEHLLMADGNGGWTAYRRVGATPLDFVQDIEGRARPDPPILLFCGIFDWVLFFEEIGAREVALPPEVAPAGIPGSTAPHALGFDDAVRIASRYLEPLERGLRRLQAYGLRNVYLHSLQPPTPDDDAFAAAFFPSTAAARYQTVRLMNHLLRGVCERTGTPFVDIWPEVTGADGMVDVRYCFDAVHLNLDAALITIEKFAEAIRARAASAAPEPVPAAAEANEEPSTMIDDVANPAELRLGPGWHPVERDRGTLFRWAGDDAMLYVPVFAAVDHRLLLDVEPGPGVGSQPFALEVYDGEDALLATFTVGGRQTLDLTLAASLPVMHRLRLHVVGGGARTPGDERVLNYRAFRITLAQQRVDVLSSVDGFRVGAGWYPLEEYGGSTFRWVNNDASIEVSSRAAELALEVEPGPGVGKQPFTLEALDASGAVLASFVVGARERVVVPLRPDAPLPYVVRLRVQGGGRATLGDSRMLNFRVFQAR
jgi:GSCFA family